ncbi:hypothetical protein M3M33_14740, partial [Loigolactobacillus coryniformis]|uniref:hypothetical protein n=1 Tax=Loigolactobacillus coryniformis TaxID=1610 RepID=UPI00201A95F6
WSAVVGCNTQCATHVTAPAGSTPEGWSPPEGFAAAVPHACLRIDAYSAPDIEGVRTDEGLRISFIPASALGTTPTPAVRPARPARPRR